MFQNSFFIQLFAFLSAQMNRLVAAKNLLLLLWLFFVVAAAVA